VPLDDRRSSYGLRLKNVPWTSTREPRMGSSSKRQTTMAKMARERALQEKRELKRQKRLARKQAKAEAAEEGVPPAEAAEPAED
jgi:hypothetical protein